MAVQIGQDEIFRATLAVFDPKGVMTFPLNISTFAGLMKDTYDMDFKNFDECLFAQDFRSVVRDVNLWISGHSDTWICEHSEFAWNVAFLCAYFDSCNFMQAKMSGKIYRDFPVITTWCSMVGVMLKFDDNNNLNMIKKLIHFTSNSAYTISLRTELDKLIEICSENIQNIEPLTKMDRGMFNRMVVWLNIVYDMKSMVFYSRSRMIAYESWIENHNDWSLCLEALKDHPFFSKAFYTKFLPDVGLSLGRHYLEFDKTYHSRDDNYEIMVKGTKDFLKTLTDLMMKQFEIVKKFPKDEQHFLNGRGWHEVSTMFILCGPLYITMKAGPDFRLNSWADVYNYFTITTRIGDFWQLFIYFNDSKKKDFFPEVYFDHIIQDINFNLQMEKRTDLAPLMSTMTLNPKFRRDF